MEEQVDSIRRSAYYQLRLIKRARDFLDLPSTRLLVQSLVISRIDYCNSLLVGLPINLLHKLQRLQNTAARLILRRPARSSSSCMLRELHWLPIQERITFKICLLAFKCILDLAPEYLKALVPQHQPGRCGLRSETEILLAVPRVKKKSYGD